MRRAAAVAAIMAIPLLAACASNRYCERSADRYHEATESPPLQAPEGLSVPQADPSLAIPPAHGPEAADPDAGAEDKAGRKRRLDCLDAPPELPPEPPAPN